MCQSAHLHWTQTLDVSAELTRRRRSMQRFPAARVRCLGPLLYPAFHRSPPQAAPAGRLKLVLASGSNGANNHLPLLEQLLPLADRLEVVALCGRRSQVRNELEGWAARQPHFHLKALGFQGPEQMAALIRSAWAHVARPGARTATEALFMACPLIFNCYSTMMPQELLAPRYFKSRGLELCIRKPADLAGIVQERLDKPGRYKALHELYLQHRLSCDPHQLIDAVLG